MCPRALVVCALLAGIHGFGWAGPGDVFVPAHRTKDGSHVPPNVAPLSGGSYLAKRPTRRTADTTFRRAEAPRGLRVTSEASLKSP